MSPMAITLPGDYAYVLAAATSAFFVNSFHTFLTGAQRKLAKVPYPTCYASAEQAEKDPAAFKFNCAQRAHSNYTENLTPFLGELLISGIQFPIASASLGVAWSVCRVLYGRGYVNNGPSGRYVGAGHSLVDIVLKLMSIYTVVKLITAA